MKRFPSFFILWGGLLSLPLMVPAQSSPHIFNPRSPDIYQFENDTLKQELRIHYITPAKAIFLVSCKHKMLMKNYEKTGFCEYVTQSKLNTQRADNEPLILLTYRSLFKKYPLELQIDARKQVARVLVPEMTPEQYFCPLASVGLLKKYSGAPSWRQSGVSEFVHYVANNTPFPNPFSFTGIVIFNCTINAQGVLTDVVFTNRSEQTDSGYPCIEKLLLETINAVPFWDPGYVDGIPREGVVMCQITFGPTPKQKSTTNPIDAVYPKTDPFTMMNKGRLRDQHKIIMLEYPRESTNTKP